MQASGKLPFTIRAFDPTRDYEGRAEIHNATYLDRPVTVAELETQDRMANPDPKYVNVRLVAELEADAKDEGRLAGHLWFGHFPGMYHPRKLYFSLAVHPLYRRQGIGSALYERMLTGIAPQDPLQVSNISFENQPEGLAFLERRGFRERMRFLESYLDLAKFDPAPFEYAFEKIRREGIEIRSEAELVPADPQYERKLYDLINEIDKDVPVPEPFTPEPFERFVEIRRKSVARIPEAFFIAIDTQTGRYAGTSALGKMHAAKFLRTGLTGVRREYRRKGIALALKLRGIEYAKSVGVPGIRTDNQSGNRPMLSINEMLGFVRGTAEIDMCKVFQTE